MQEEPMAVDGIVGAQMLDPRTQQVARPPNDAMNRVASGQQQLAEIGTILAGDPGDERALCFRHLPSMVEGGCTGKMENHSFDSTQLWSPARLGSLQMNREILISQF